MKTSSACTAATKQQFFPGICVLYRRDPFPGGRKSQCGIAKQNKLGTGDGLFSVGTNLSRRVFGLPKETAHNSTRNTCGISCARSYRTLRDGSFGVRCPRHFVPGYDHAVPPGQEASFSGVASIQKTISSRGRVYIRDKEISIHLNDTCRCPRAAGISNREFCR